MGFLDMRTVIFVYLGSTAICALVMLLVWLQNRRRYAGTGFWAWDFALQAAALFLVILRGIVPDWASMVLSNTMAVGGALLGLMGYERFTGKRGTQIHNYIIMALFVMVHSYFTFIKPDLAMRSLVLSAGLFIMCFQAAWLMLSRVPGSMRTLTLGVGLVNAAFCAVNAVRIIEFSTGPHTAEDFFKTGGYDALMLVFFQVLLILLTYSIVLMVNQRLERDVCSEQEKFYKAFHSSPYAITITRVSDGKIIEVNDGFVKITGYSYAEAVGNTTPGLGLWAHDGDRASAIAELSARGSVQEAEFKFRKKTGELLTGLFSAYTMPINSEPCVISSINDITERKSAEEIIHARTQLIEFSVAHSVEEVLQQTLDEVGRLTDSPIGFYHFLGADQQTLSLQAWSTRTMKDFCTAEGKGSHYNIDQAGVWVDCIRQRRPVIHNDYASLPHRKGLPPGHAQVIRELVVPIMRNNSIVAVLGVGNKPVDYTQKDVEIVSYLADVTWDVVEHKVEEEKLELLTRELERSNRDLAQFASVASHDLREPLRTITQYLDLLAGRYRGKLDKDADEFIGFARQGAVRLHALISDLLAYARMKGGTGDFKAVDCESVMAAAVGNLQTAIEESGAVVTHDKLPPVKASASQMTQLFQNLIDNAIKFRTDTPARVHVSARESSGEWEFSVRDNGIGIDPKYREKIFIIFQRLHSREAYPGTGIGLALCKKIVEHHNGRIWFESEPGKGTTFLFTIPK